MIIHRDIIQGSPEWFAKRKGKATASHATAIATASKGLDTYVLEIVSEFFSSGEKEGFENEHTKRGKELEAQARSIYELMKDVEVEQVGFIEHNEYIGCSPDGLVSEVGGVEIKCYDDKCYLYLITEGEKAISSDYMWQIQMNLLITGREWWDFVAYNPNFSKPIFIHRIYPNEEKFKALKIGFIVAEEKIKQLINKYNLVNL